MRVTALSCTSEFCHEAADTAGTDSTGTGKHRLAQAFPPEPDLGLVSLLVILYFDGVNACG